MSGSKAATSLAAIVARKEKLEEELRNVEKQVYDLETAYLNDQGQCGNVLKGFEGFLSSSKNNANAKRLRKFQPEDRLFSLSSVTSPAGEEMAGTLLPEYRHEGVVNGGGIPRKQTTTSSNGTTKNANQKRGRTGPREGKRMRQTTEQEEEDDDLLV